MIVADPAGGRVQGVADFLGALGRAGGDFLGADPKIGAVDPRAVELLGDAKQRRQAFGPNLAENLLNPGFDGR